MTLKDYFEKTGGLGFLATSDADGRVNGALYGRPHFIDESQVAFIMTDRLTHKNLQSNPHAAYLFREHGEKHKGRRLYLTKTGEEQDSPLIDILRRRKPSGAESGSNASPRFLVFFRIDSVLPLVGDHE